MVAFHFGFLGFSLVFLFGGGGLLQRCFFFFGYGSPPLWGAFCFGGLFSLFAFSGGGRGSPYWVFVLGFAAPPPGLGSGSWGCCWGTSFFFRCSAGFNPLFFLFPPPLGAHQGPLPCGGRFGGVGFFLQWRGGMAVCVFFFRGSKSAVGNRSTPPEQSCSNRRSGSVTSPDGFHFSLAAVSEVFSALCRSRFLDRHQPDAICG